MPKQVIVIMQDNYPFGECEQCTTESTRVLVRKIYQVSVQERSRLLQRVNVLRKLKNQHMIRIQSVLEQQQSIHFLFEYIPIKLQTWISNINDQFIENFRDQLIKFSSFLANNYIKIEFQLKNIGMDQNYGAKYFLDLNFQVDNKLNRQKLKSNYIRQITNLFKPYIINSSEVVENNYVSQSQRKFSTSRQNTKNTSIVTTKGQDLSISPPTNKNISVNKDSSKSREKALQKYYQQVNMSVDSQNQKILQQFMDVLDDQQEQAALQHKTQISKNKAQLQQNQFQKNQKPQQYVQPPATNSSNNSNKNTNNTNKQASSANLVQHIEPQKKIVHHNAEILSKQNLKSKQQALSYARQSQQLQSRVKNAIQKSLTVIKKFKSIKDSSIV